MRDGFATLALVTIATPESEKRAYPVPGGRGKRCAPYDFIAYRATVERVVRAGADLPALAATASLAIVPANVPDLVDLTHRACVDGVSKSPIWERYAGREPAPGLHLLVVLRWHKDYGWLESVAGGWLDAAELARVEAVLAPPQPAPAP
ncbi:MAG: hypothetical protein U1F43_34955 [Myxococcota bacterium]